MHTLLSKEISTDPKGFIRRIKAVLRDFARDVPEMVCSRDTEGYRPPRDQFPLPDLVLIVLRDVMGFHWAGHGEKVRWSVYCSFGGAYLEFTLRKFGFYVVVQKTEPAVDLDRALHQLQHAVHLLEGVLQVVAEQQIREGNVTLANLFIDLDNRYRFFREKAEQVYPMPDTAIRFDEEGNPVAWTFRRGQREGWYYTGAMIDAFFSRMEHLLVLVLPFTNFDPTNGWLRKVIAMQWDDKFKTVFDIATNDKARAIYDRLRTVKEHFRNRVAHGGFEKGWASLFFHLPGVGAIPASFSQFRNSLQFNFIPVDQSGHKQICDLFDEVEGLFQTGDVGRGYEFAVSGLNVAFDVQTRSRYRAAMRSAKSFADLIDRESYLADRHANMDY